jgi:outer membrane immunogenic protein
MTFKKLVRMGAAVGALIFAVQANAADLNGGSFKGSPDAFAAPMWNGFYVGVNGGYGWRDTSDQFAYGVCPGTPGCQGTYPAYGGIGANGGFGGGQIGYSRQGILGTPWLVAGIEADIQGAGISGSGTDLYGEPFKTNLDWFGTVRGRAGYAASNTLIYFTGGFAFGGLSQHAEDATYTPTAVYSSDATVTGYTLGGGVEYKFNPSWSVKAEYQYLNFGKNDPGFASGGAGSPASALADGFKLGEDAFHTVRVGVNYWVGPAYMPLK